MNNSGNNHFHTDYQNVEFILSETFDDKINQLMFQKQNITKPNIFCVMPSEQARNLPFCIETAAHYTVGSRYFTRSSGTNNYYLIYTLEGQGIVISNTETYHCKKGTILLLDCNTPHICRSAQGSTWEFKNIFFTTNGGELIIQQCMGLNTVVGEVNRCFDSIFKELSDIKQETVFLLSHYVSSILTEIIVNKNQAISNSLNLKLITETADYMRAHYSEQIKVKELAQKNYISVYYFIRLFKDYYGESPYEYLINYRINVAKEQILQMVPFEEIARNCGLGNLNNFFRIFKTHTGMTPSQYRTQYTGNSIL